MSKFYSFAYLAKIEDYLAAPNDVESNGSMFVRGIFPKKFDMSC